MLASSVRIIATGGFMMTRIVRTTLVLVLSVTAVGIAGETKADHAKANKGTFAGTALQTRIDNNSDGVAAIWSTLEVKDRFGKSTIQSVVEEVPIGPTSECPGGVGIVDAKDGIGSGVFTQTFRNGEDQIYYQLLTRTDCYDLTFAFVTEDAGIVVGGAGRFKGVSGTFKIRSTGAVQAFGPTAVPTQAFGSYTGKIKVWLTRPGKGDDNDSD